MTLKSDWPCVALPHAPLADRTTLRVGGQVEWLLEPKTPDELRQAWIAARDFASQGPGPERPVRVLGGGANLVVGDGELPGVVISTEQLRRVFRPTGGSAEALAQGVDETDIRMAQAAPADDPRLVAWCGAPMPGLLRRARDLGLSGLEGIVGVPGHVGGGVAMNAGGRWGEMWDVIETVRVLDADGAPRDLARDECAPSYRDANLDGRLVVAVVMRFEPQPKLVITERMAEYLREKRRVQPVTEWSAGCVFKNPNPEVSDGRSAGLLVDEYGGKQLSRGDAIVSPIHGNFIVNRGKATAVDVLTLMDDMRALVAEKSGIWLEFEVQRWLP